ncbi:MAG: S24 family peptidase [Saprospiraceae bacterium]|nr:S24 family peptidase [Saprospiraceae bacterium]
MGAFSENVVNQQFKKVYEELEKSNRIKGKSDIAKNLDTYNHVINSILKGDRNITVDQISKLCNLYGVSSNYLFGLSDDMYLMSHPANKNLSAIPGGEMSVIGRNNIRLVPNLARAGAALGLDNRENMDDFPRFSVPGMSGDLWAFKIDGDSMLPTITNGDIVVCERLEPNEPIRDNQVYVVVSDVVVAKRVQQVKEGNQVASLRLISDNSDVYKPYELGLEEIRYLLRVKCRLTNHAIA